MSWVSPATAVRTAASAMVAKPICRGIVGGGWHPDKIMLTLTQDAARRTAVAAQGFADPRPTSAPSRRHLQRVLSRTQLIQLDSVNVAVRAHYMPLFSRVGAYPFSLIDDAAWSNTSRKPRLLVEKWAHE